jgi:hypothetical protein
LSRQSIKTKRRAKARRFLFQFCSAEIRSRKLPKVDIFGNSIKLKVSVMIDRYTKLILTVIAGALVVLAGESECCRQRPHNRKTAAIV